MLKKHLKILLLLVLMVIFTAPLCFAKTKGYCYVVAYSDREKTVYFSPVFIQKVRDVAYNAEEFVAEVELIQKMEAAFEKYVRNTLGFYAADMTTTARAAYKSAAIANQRLNAEKQGYAKRSFEVKEAKNFQF